MVRAESSVEQRCRCMVELDHFTGLDNVLRGNDVCICWMESDGDHIHKVESNGDRQYEIESGVDLIRETER